jgi:hypothetical protein
MVIIHQSMAILHQNIVQVNRVNSLSCKIVGLELRYAEIPIMNYPDAEQLGINRNTHNRPKGRGINAPEAHETFIRRICG